MPDLLEKSFEKASKEVKGDKKVPLKNDLESIKFYFCNPFIRHKVYIYLK